MSMKYTIIFLLLALSLSAKTYVISGGKNNTPQIIASKIMKVAYSRSNLDVEIKFLNLEDSLKASNSGETDGEIARIKKISLLYENLVIVPVQLITVDAIAFSKDTNITVTKWDDLKDYDVTIVKGAKFIEKAMQDMNKTFVPTFKEAFENLVDNKTKIIVVPRLAGLKYIYLHDKLNIKPISKSLQSVKLYHFVNKKNEDLVPILKNILEDMKASGEINYWHKSYIKSLVPHHKPTSESSH